MLFIDFGHVARRASVPECVVLQGRVVSFRQQDSFGGAVQIVVLPGVQGPQERREARKAHPESDWNQPREVTHAASAIWRGRAIVAAPVSGSRSAFATTSMDDADIATAAINGVT